MSWITPTEADILTRCSQAELDVFRAAGLGEGQADPVAKTIEIVVNFMRDYIFACPTIKRADHDEGTIPPSGLHAFLDIIVPTIQGRPAGAVIEGNGNIRIDSKSDAMKWLIRASECKLGIDGMVSPDKPGAPIPKPRLKTRDRGNTHGI